MWIFVSYIPFVFVIFSDLVIVSCDSSTKNQPLPFILHPGFFGNWSRNGVEKVVWAAQGNDTILFCRILGLGDVLKTQPTASIIWLKDDKSLDNKRAVIRPEGHLELSKIRGGSGRSGHVSDGGEYRCLLLLQDDLEYVVSSPPISLIVAEMSRDIVVTGSRYGSSSLENGSPVRLSCDVTSEPPPFIYWTKNNDKLPPSPRIFEPTSGVLQIIDLQESDSGIYKCVAVNTFLNETRVSDSVSVSVVKGGTSAPYLTPNFLYPLTPLEVSEVIGFPVTLECLATSQPVSVTWKKMGVHSMADHPWEDVTYSKRVVKYGQGNLHFKAVTAGDAGRYRCVATSLRVMSRDTVSAVGASGTKENVSSVSQEIKLKLIRPPEYLAEPPVNTSIHNAETARINCSPRQFPGELNNQYYPRPKVTWLKNGYPLVTDARVEVRNEDQLIFINAVSKDSGIYQCLVTNEAGYSTAWAYLNVSVSDDMPTPPTDLIYTLLSPTSVLVQWSYEAKNKNENINDSLIAFTVHLIESGTTTETEDSYVITSLSHYFDSLKPNTNYSLFVRSYTSFASDPSETIHFTTAEDVPAGPPEFTLMPLSASTVLVSWQQLHPSTARGTVKGYKIQWRYRRRDYYNLKEVGSNVFEYTLTKLLPAKTYKIRVVARTKSGYNSDDDSGWKTITMPGVMPEQRRAVPGAPSIELVVKGPLDSLDKFEIEVKYSRAKSESTDVDGFSLQYKKVSDNWSEEIILPIHKTIYLMQNLDPAWYHIKLWAYNTHGRGLATVEEIQIGTTTGAKDPRDNLVTRDDDEAVPIIKGLSLTPGSQTIVHLVWEAESPPGRPVAFYTIRQQKIARTGAPPPPVLSRSTTPSISIHELVRLEIYEFSVRAHLNDGVFGPYSPPVQTSTADDVLKPPVELGFEPKDASTVELRWEVPMSSDGNSWAYQVAYTRNTSLPYADWEVHDVDTNQLQASIGGLISNTQYWFKIRSCSEKQCGPYSDSYPASIPAVLPDKTSLHTLLLAVGLSLLLIVLIFLIVFIIYIRKFRPGSHFRASASSSGSGIAGKGPLHLGVSDLGGAKDGDYIPMLNRVHALNTPSMDTKGGDMHNRPKCNGVIRIKQPQYSTTEEDCTKDDECDEKQKLFPSSPRNGGLMLKDYGVETPPEDEEPPPHNQTGNGGPPLCLGEKSFMSPQTRVPHFTMHATGGGESVFIGPADIRLVPD